MIGVPMSSTYIDIAHFIIKDYKIWMTMVEWQIFSSCSPPSRRTKEDHDCFFVFCLNFLCHYRWIELPFLAMRLSTWRNFSKGSTTFKMSLNQHLQVLHCLQQMQRACTPWLPHYQLCHAVWRMNSSTARVLYQVQIVIQQGLVPLA